MQDHRPDDQRIWFCPLPVSCFSSLIWKVRIHNIIFFKDFIYLFIWGEEGREGEKHQCVRDTSIGHLSHTPIWRPSPQPRHMDLTRNRTGNLSVFRPALNPTIHTSQGHNPILGFNVDCLNLLSKFSKMIHNLLKSFLKNPFNYYINLESPTPSISWQWERILLHYNPQLHFKCPALCQQIAYIKTQKPALVLMLLQSIVEALLSF